MASAAAAGPKAFGLDCGVPFPLADIPGAETILLVGANLAERMPPIMQYFEAQRRHGGNLLVADPRVTPTARAARLHLQLTPGTDAALANGFRREPDRSRIHRGAHHGLENARKTAVAHWPERVERITGVPVHQLYESARMLGRARTAMSMASLWCDQGGMRPQGGASICTRYAR